MGRQKGYRHTEETKLKIGLGHKGNRHTDEAKAQIGIASIGRKPWLGKHRSAETKEKLRQANLGKKQSESTKLKRSIALLGSRNPNWKGGLTPEGKRVRNLKKYEHWRKIVFERDGYICQSCHQKGYKLNAHHRQVFSENVELRFNVDNGITLCYECHKAIHFHKMAI